MKDVTGVELNIGDVVYYAVARTAGMTSILRRGILVKLDYEHNECHILVVLENGRTSTRKIDNTCERVIKVS